MCPIRAKNASCMLSSGNGSAKNGENSGAGALEAWMRPGITWLYFSLTTFAEELCDSLLCMASNEELVGSDRASESMALVFVP